MILKVISTHDINYIEVGPTLCSYITFMVLFENQHNILFQNIDK